MGSANAGMSSVKADEKSAHRKPEVSYGRVIRVGLGGPKPRPKGVGDGQTVSIPSLPTFVEATRTQGGTPSAPIGHGASLLYSKGARRVETTVKAIGAGLDWQEKPVVEDVWYPYRKPTLVGGCKCTKVGERTFVKELGNLTP